MNRESEAQLPDYCARQRRAFQKLARLEADHVSHGEMVATCLFSGRLDCLVFKTQLVGIDLALAA